MLMERLIDRNISVCAFPCSLSVISIFIFSLVPIIPLLYSYLMSEAHPTAAHSFALNGLSAAGGRCGWVAIII